MTQSPRGAVGDSVLGCMFDRRFAPDRAKRAMTTMWAVVVFAGCCCGCATAPDKRDESAASILDGDVMGPPLAVQARGVSGDVSYSIVLRHSSGPHDVVLVRGVSTIRLPLMRDDAVALIESEIADGDDEPITVKVRYDPNVRVTYIDDIVVQGRALHLSDR
jgi:hypothetical protein